MLEMDDIPLQDLSSEEVARTRSIFGTPPSSSSKLAALRTTPFVTIQPLLTATTKQNYPSPILIPQSEEARFDSSDKNIYTQLPSSSPDPIPPSAILANFGSSRSVVDPEHTSTLIPFSSGTTATTPTLTPSSPTNSPRVLVPIIIQSPHSTRSPGTPKKKVTWPDEAQGGSLVQIKHVERLPWLYDDDEFDLAQTNRPRAPKWLRFLMHNKYVLLLSCFGVLVCLLFTFLAFSVLS